MIATIASPMGRDGFDVCRTPATTVVVVDGLGVTRPAPELDGTRPPDDDAELDGPASPRGGAAMPWSLGAPKPTGAPLVPLTGGVDDAEPDGVADGGAPLGEPPAPATTTVAFVYCPRLGWIGRPRLFIGVQLNANEPGDGNAYVTVSPLCNGTDAEPPGNVLEWSTTQKPRLSPGGGVPTENVTPSPANKSSTAVPFGAFAVCTPVIPSCADTVPGEATADEPGRAYASTAAEHSPSATPRPIRTRSR